MRILVIDADSLLRDGLCALLRLENHIDVIGTLNRVAGAAGVALGTTPDAVILDVVAEGVAVIGKVRQRWPHTRVVVLTSQQDGRLLAEALRAGADAYVLKSDTRLELANALRSVQKGQRYVSPTMREQPVGRASDGQRNLDELTDREREVMRRIARGHRTREIAYALSLSHKTIEKHRGSLMRKLGLKSATAVAAYAIANGYLDD